MYRDDVNVYGVEHWIWEEVVITMGFKKKSTDHIA